MRVILKLGTAKPRPERRLAMTARPEEWKVGRNYRRGQPAVGGPLTLAQRGPWRVLLVSPHRSSRRVSGSAAQIPKLIVRVRLS